MVEALQAPGDPLRSFGAPQCTLQHPDDPSHIRGGGQLSIQRGLDLLPVHWITCLYDPHERWSATVLSRPATCSTRRWRLRSMRMSTTYLSRGLYSSLALRLEKMSTVFRLSVKMAIFASGAVHQEAWWRAVMMQRNSKGRIWSASHGVPERTISTGVTDTKAKLSFRYQKPIPVRHASQKIAISASPGSHVSDRTMKIPGSHERGPTVHERLSRTALLTKIKSFGSVFPLSF